MSTHTMYVSLWDRNGIEAAFPGYCRQSIYMDVSMGAASNSAPVVWPINGYMHTEITTLKIHQQMWGEAVLECVLTSPIGRLNSGDTLTIGNNNVSATLGGMANAFVGTSANIAVKTFDEFLQEHPGATLREIWDEAFLAGHQTAHILLTGDAE